MFYSFFHDVEANRPKKQADIAVLISEKKNSLQTKTRQKDISLADRDSSKEKSHDSFLEMSSLILSLQKKGSLK